ncbi:DedA family protein [Agrobacterium sp. ES01]|uniref:DedA family protein n=1 Tax=Agrobacterium sp. ES01 TaxID=3420714 RepID=UPI003D0E1CAB
MSEAFLALVPTYGLPLLALVTVLGCLALPVPSSLVLLVMGSLVAADEFSLTSVFLTALAAAFFGDQIGFVVGRVGGAAILKRVGQNPTRQKTLTKAQDTMARHGSFAIFLCHWLLSPLAPYVNLIAGVTRFSWPAFFLLSCLGNTIWVMVYVGLGFFFSDHVIAIAKFASNATGFLVAATIAGLLGWQLISARRTRHSKKQR